MDLESFLFPGYRKLLGAPILILIMGLIFIVGAIVLVLIFPNSTLYGFAFDAVLFLIGASLVVFAWYIKRGLGSWTKWDY